jgi:hypothetical protein
MPDGKPRHRGIGSYQRMSREYFITIFTPPLDADLKTPDEWAAYYFLAGAAVQGPPDSPLVHRKYLHREKECMGRQALVRALRSDRPLSTSLRKKLAALFDDLSDAAERRLILKFRAEGQRSNPWGNAQVANYVAYKNKQLNSKTKAVETAAIFFGLDEKTISPE